MTRDQHDELDASYSALKRAVARGRRDRGHQTDRLIIGVRADDVDRVLTALIDARVDAAGVPLHLDDDAPAATTGTSA